MALIFNWKLIVKYVNNLGVFIKFILEDIFVKFKFD